MKTEDIINLVNELNCELMEQNENFYYEHGCLFTYNSCGFQDCIEFLGLTLWDSDNDDREYEDQGDNQVPLEPYIRGKADLIIAQLSKLKFYKDAK